MPHQAVAHALPVIVIGSHQVEQRGIDINLPKGAFNVRALSTIQYQEQAVAPIRVDRRSARRLVVDQFVVIADDDNERVVI